MFGFTSASANSDITKISDLPEFDGHELVSFAEDARIGFRSIIAIHRGNPAMPSFGATRLWHYATSLEGVKDALRLSRGMSYKAALAGLRCGGAKGVILAPEMPTKMKEGERSALISAYADRVNLFGGRFVTGTDVGVRQEDLETMRAHSRHIVGFNDNSTHFTACGVFESVKAALEVVFGSADPAGRSFAIQGLGKIGEGLLHLLYESAGAAGKIFVSDIDVARVEKIGKNYPRVIVVSTEEITLQEVDVFAPCALGGILTPACIEKLQVKIVAGGANNQLADEAAGDLLHARNILYVPDYVANAGGLIAVFDEYKNPSYDEARVAQAVLHIPDTVRKIFAESRATNTAPNRVANALAEDIFNSYGTLAK